MDLIPNVERSIKSKNFENYDETHPTAILLKYGSGLKRVWHIVIDKSIIPLNQEL